MAVLAHTFLSLMTFAMIFFHSKLAEAEMTGAAVYLPDRIGVWTKSDSVQHIDSKNIFQYMNGAGELYLGYRFDHLRVYEYTAEKKHTIQAEVYIMKSADDAFGLLSLDWSGNPVTFQSSARQGENPVTSGATALYDAGLLRLQVANIYVRILCMRETKEIRDAILALGEALQSGTEPTPEPELLKILPPVVEEGWRLRSDRIGWLRSYLVLNSLFYISHQNILELDHSVEAVTAPYEKQLAEGAKRVQFVVVKYETEEHSENALSHFQSAYLPEFGTGNSGLYLLEDGWLGCRRGGKYLAIVFQCPDENAANAFISGISFQP